MNSCKKCHGIIYAQSRVVLSQECGNGKELSYKGRVMYHDSFVVYGGFRIKKSPE